MKIGIFATGGTIAMTSRNGVPGIVPTSHSSTLLDGTSIDDGICLQRIDMFAKPSASMTLHDVQDLADRIDQEFAEGLDGAVITHGTDTLEETAFALAFLLERAAPVVITGAMRGIDASGADGPANLTAAVKVAACPDARGHGPLVLFGDEIHAAHLVRKVHSSRLHAFSSEPFGPIGEMVEGQPSFSLTPLFSPRRLRVGTVIPPIPVLQVGLDLEPETVEAFASGKFGGVILAGVGGGHVSARAMDAIEHLGRQLPVVITSRVGMGETLRASYGYEGSEIDLERRGIINGGRLRPAQARILLQILLSNGNWSGSFKHALEG